jgi:hypothetical protein
MRAGLRAALFAAAAIFASSSGAAIAQSPGPSPAPKPAATMRAAGASPAPSAAPEPADYEKFVKLAEKQPGLFPIYRVGGKVYLEVRDDQLDTDYLEHIVPANGVGGYGLHSGDQFAQTGRIVRFHDLGKSVSLIWPHTRFVSTPGTAVATAVRESTADSVEAVLPVAVENKALKIRILDASPLLGDLLDLGPSLSNAVGAETNPLGSYRLDPARTYFGPSKAFAQNVIVEADQTFASQSEDGVDTVPDARFVQMRVKYNFSQILSSPGYMPRLYDDRVGFWEDPHAAFDRDSEYDNLRWYVLRWDVEASDPTQRVSPAKKPIVFYLDRSIPDEYRGAVRDGILEWNKAFERMGVSGAVQVLDPPNDPAWDADDIRYSVVRWVTDEPTEFGAEAQIVWDPRTGEIFRGGVLLDSNLGRFARFSERSLISALTFPGDDGAFSTSAVAANSPASPAKNPYLPMHDESTFAAGEDAQAAFGATALTLMDQKGDLDAYVYQRIKAVAMHEVGHDFGLSHNFIGHNAFTPSELKSASFTKANGTSSSVMDYWPVNVWPKGTSHGTYFPTTIGPYDYHAIHWGYAPVPGARTPHDEVATLARWAQSSADPKYAFAGDEDGDFNGGHAIDPRAAPFLLSNRPIDWCATQLDMTKGFIATIDRRFPAPQESWQIERGAFLTLLGRYNTCASSLTHYIGGEYLTRDRIGDPGVETALSPVPRAEEKRAYGLLDRFVFADSNWNFSPFTLRRLVYTEYMPFANFGYDPQARHDVPVVELVGSMQRHMLANMFAPLVLQRLADMPTKARPGTTMSLADLFSWTQTSMFGDIAKGRPSSQIRRNLQRAYARMLARMAVAPLPGTPLDAQALARVELADLDDATKRALATHGLDLQTRAHLAALRTDVEHALDAKAVLPVASL